MLHEGEHIGPYVVTEQLGTGGMATVYRAYHPRLDRYVAIKMMHQIFLEDKSFRARFEREAQIVAQLEHPNIVSVYDFDEHNGQPYLAMKYVEGRTLKEVLTEDGALSLDEICTMMTGLADALTYAHEQGVLHRDIKPSNIVIDEHGVPHLTDFGLARIAQAGESTISQDMLLGTPQYISPEQAKGGIEIDSRADVYSLGVVLYELVVGQVPFSGDTPYSIVHDQIYTPLPLPRQVNPDVPESVEKVLVKALSKRPDDRYSSAKEMMDAFYAAVCSEGKIDLKPDRAEIAAASLAEMRRKSAKSVSDEPRSGDASAAIVPSPARKSRKPHPPIPPVPPSPEADPAGYARYQVERTREDVSRALEGVIGPQRLEKLGGAIDWVQSKAMEKIEEKIERGEFSVNESKMQIDWDKSKHKDNDEDPGGFGESDIRRRVERRLDKRKELNVHFGIFVVVNIMIWAIWSCSGGLISSIFAGGPLAFLANIATFPWAALVTMGWGGGLVAHWIDVHYETGRPADAREDAVEDEMRFTFGDDWRATVTDNDYKSVRRRVIERFNKPKELIEHLSMFAVYNTMFWLMYILGGGLGSFAWPIIITLGWGIGLVFHVMDYYGHTGRRLEAREEAIRREIERERSRAIPAYDEGQKAKRKQKRDERQVGQEDDQRHVRLTADGELTESFVEEWDEKQQRKRR